MFKKEYKFIRISLKGCDKYNIIFLYQKQLFKLFLCYIYILSVITLYTIKLYFIYD